MEEQNFGGPYLAILELFLPNFLYGKIVKKKKQNNKKTEAEAGSPMMMLT